MRLDSLHYDARKTLIHPFRYIFPVRLSYHIVDIVVCKQKYQVSCRNGTLFLNDLSRNGNQVSLRSDFIFFYETSTNTLFPCIWPKQDFHHKLRQNLRVFAFCKPSEPTTFLGCNSRSIPFHPFVLIYWLVVGRERNIYGNLFHFVAISVHCEHVH